MPEFDLSRREFLHRGGLTALGAKPVIEEVAKDLGKIALRWLLNPRSRAAASAVAGVAPAMLSAGKYEITPIDFEPGRGAQSHLWLPARVDVSRRLDTLDQAEQIDLGDRALSAFRGSSGELYQKGATALMNRTASGSSWVGDCFPASVASGNCPIIEGGLDSPAEGLPGMSWEDRMVLATLYHRFSFREKTWGRPWTRDKLSEIQDIQADLEARGIRKYLIGDTSDMRGFPGQNWYVLIRGFSGDSALTTAFLDWEELGEGPHRKGYPVSNYTSLTSITLADPSQADPGLDNNYLHSMNREWAQVYLGMAEASLR